VQDVVPLAGSPPTRKIPTPTARRRPLARGIARAASDGASVLEARDDALERLQPLVCQRRPLAFEVLMPPMMYKNYEEFEREEIRSRHRVGFSLDDLIEELSFDAELDFDPFAESVED
jgi:hypothetical protein